MGIYDGLEEVTAAPRAPTAPKAPPGLYDGLEQAPVVGQAAPRAAAGLSESLQAGFQASAPGLAWRGRLPDLVLDPEHAKWWERAATGFAQVASELPLMAIGGAAGGAAGAAAGTAAAPGPGTAIGTVLGTGAGMFAVPGAIRESLIQAYKSGEVSTAADYWNILREVAATTAKEATIGAVTFGAGSAAARTLGKALVPAITDTMTVSTGIKAINTADTAAQIAAMTTMPAAMQGRLPDAQEFMDAAIVIGGLKAAHIAAVRITNVFAKTGRTPAEQIADAHANPEIAKEMATPGEPRPETEVPPLRGQLSKQEELWTIQDRLNALVDSRAGKPEQKTVDDYGNEVTVPAKQPELFTYAEKQEYDALRAKASALEAEGVKPEVPRGTTPESTAGPRYAPEDLAKAEETARTRLEALAAKSTSEALTDTERAERIGLTNALGNPEALAKRFGIQPLPEHRGPTEAEREASAQRVYDDVLRQAKQADAARAAAGIPPIGDEHAHAVAALVRARIRTRAARLGVLPEDLYNERPLQIRDESQAEVSQDLAAAAADPEAPRFTPPEVDLFGEPIQTTTPRHAVEAVEPRMVPVKDLTLSKDVPQFKGAANEKGIVEPLTGAWDPTGVGAIQIWERMNGALEVISGRHRLDKVQREGIPEIWAQIHREADGFTRDMASALDAVLNIRDGQGSIADYAQYFKSARITEAAADAAGLLGRAKGRAGFAIARDASPDLLAAHRAGLLSDDAALSISQTAPGSDRLQALGIAMVNDGKSILYAANMMRSIDLMASERMAAGAQGDIFGFDDSAMREAAAMAKKASSAQRKISEQISAVSGASKRPELARKMGVDVQDPEGIQKKIAELKQEQYQWDNWPLYPELVAKLRGQELKQAKLLPGEEQWYHGTREDLTAFTPGGEVYITDRPTEAAGYAQGLHLGGTGAEQPRVYSIAAKKGKTLNIDDMISEEIMNGAGEIEVALDAGIAKAKAEGARYVEYQHPAFEGEAEQNVRISLYPAEDLRITHKPTRDRGGTLYQNELAKRVVTDLKEKHPNVVVRDVRDRDGNKLGDIFEKYDGSEEGARAAAQRIEQRLQDEYPDYSNVASRIGATDENGDPKWAISPNLAHVNRIGTQEAAYTWGDMNAAPAVTPAKIAEISGYIEKTKASIADAEAKRAAGGSVKDVDDRFRDWNDYLTNERRVLEYQTDNLKEAQAKLLQAPATVAIEFELKAETPAELKARDEEAAAAAKRKLAQERAGVKGPVPTVDQADLFSTQRTLFQTRTERIVGRVLAEHGEQDSPNPEDPRTRISNETANRLAKEKSPDAGIAALLAFVSDDFTVMTRDVKIRRPQTRALVQFIKDMEPSRSGDLYRVLAFETETDRMAFLKKMAEGAGGALQSERAVMSFTADNPEGAGPMQNVGRDVASQFGEHSVVIQISPSEGKTLNIGRDVSFLYKGSIGEGAGVEYLIPRGTQFKLRPIESRDGEPWITLEPTSGQTDRVLFQSKEDKPWYYSELAKQIDALPADRIPAEGLTAAQWQKLIWESETTKKVAIRDAKNKPTGETKEVVVQGKSNLPGVKQEEIEATGINDWLATQEGKVTKEQVQAFMEQGGVKVTETVLGGPGTSDPRSRLNALNAQLGEKGYSVDVTDEDGFMVARTVVRLEDGKRFDFDEASQGAARGFPAGLMEDLGRIGEEIYNANENVGEHGDAKFSDYQLPGSVPGSYRELVLTLPAKKPSTELPPGYEVQLMHPRSRPPQWTLVGPDGVGQVMNYLIPDSPRLAAIMEAQRILNKGKMPDKQTFESSHFPDAGNYLAHTRVNDRILPDGRKVLFVEEIQSDRAQKGRTTGFADEAEAVRLVEENRAVMRKYGAAHAGDTAIPEQERQQIYENSVRAGNLRQGPPTAPFVTKTDSWTALVLKRLLRYAAEGDYDAIAWTRGEQQVERYTSALRKAVDTIEWKKTPEGVQIVGYKGKAERAHRYAIVDENGITAGDWQNQAAARTYETEAAAREDYEAITGRTPEADGQRVVISKSQRGRQTKVVDTTEKESALSDAIGKSMADRIRNDPAQTGTIEGENININDTGMAGYYDRIVPKVAEKVAKQVGGGKVGEITMDNSKPGTVDVAPNFRDFTPAEWGTFAGAEEFKGFGAERKAKDPVIAVVQVAIDGKAQEADVMIDGTGVHIVDAEGAHDFYIPKETYLPRVSAAGWQDSVRAEALVKKAWMDPEHPMWLEAQDLLGDTKPVLGPAPATESTGKQMALEITPAMREKIMAGQALFQGKGQESAAGEHLGSYSIAENLITTFQNANKSTIIHELSHSWLEEMRQDAARPDAPEQIKADWELIRREFAIGEDGDISTASHEQFARTGERYLGEGFAPSVGLRAVFERFKTWMLELYSNLQNLGVTINPEVRGVFDRMLATDQEIADAKELDVPRAYVPEARQAEAEKIVPPPQEGKKLPPPGFKDEQLAMEPLAEELKLGPGSGPTEDSRVNAQYINGPMDLRLAIQRVSEIDQANIQKHRGGAGGVKSWEQANAEADAMVLDTMGGKMVDTGPSPIPHDIRQRAAFKVMMAVAKYSLELRDQILQKGDNATVQDQFDYLNSIVRMRMTHAEFLGLRAAAARAQNQMRDMTPESGIVDKMVELTSGRELFQTVKSEADQAAVLRVKLQQMMDQHFSGKSALDIAKLQRQIGTLKGQLVFADAVTKATKWEMVVEGWRAGLLSGPVTHTTNLFGTGAFQVLRTPVDALAAIIGMARGASSGMGESDRGSMSDAVAGLTAYLGAAVEGAKVGYHAFMLDQITGKTESYREAIPGRAGELIRVPLRLMGAEDAMVTTMYERKLMRQLAMRQAFDENLNPATREFGERVDHLLDHPTPEIQAAIESEATRMTFNAPLGEKGAALQHFVREWNLQWMVPFIRTPINIAKELLRMSPFAPAVAEWRAAIAKGGVERDKAVAEIMIGSAITTATMAYAFAGNVSGAGSPDQGKNRAKVGVWQPYSVLIDDKWYEYSRIQPTGTLIGMAADIAAVWDHMTPEEMDKVPKMLAAAFANAITNQTFLQGITNFVNAMSDPTRFGPRFLQQFAGSMVPNVIGQPTTMADPLVREVNGMLEAIQARIPGLRQDLLPKRDWLGATIKTKERFGVIMPVREQQISEDKVRLEAARLELSVATAPRKTHLGKGTGKLGDVELTPKERDVFAKVGGEFAHKILTNIVAAPGYDQIPDMIKRKIFSEVLSGAHKVAAVQALSPEKRQAYLQEITEKVAAELTTVPAQ